MPTRTRRPARGGRHTPPSRTAKKSTGLTAKTYSGLNEKRMKQKSSGSAIRLIQKQGETVAVQFLTTPRDMKEFDQHQWQDGGTWFYVPCTGDTETCEPCQSEDATVRKLHYKFLANVWSLRDKKVLIYEGPKTLATQVFYRYKRKPSSFTKRVFDITKFPTNPVTYNFELAEERPVNTAGLKLHDLDAYIQGELERYYGEGGTKKPQGRGKTALDEDDFEDEDDFDDEEEEDDEEYEDEDDDADEDPEEDEMMDKDAWPWSELKQYGRDLGLKRDYTKRTELVRNIIKKRGF